MSTQAPSHLDTYILKSTAPGVWIEWLRWLGCYVEDSRVWCVPDGTEE
jgi:hypothetical protein